jgi:hypothetical protein
VSIFYKLTDQNGYTRARYPNACLWGPGVTQHGTGEGDLCGPGFIHAYKHPLLAVLLNPIHANIQSPRLWEAEGEIAKDDKGLKVGCVSLTTLRELPLPVVTDEQRVRFAILCAKEVVSDRAWNHWADKWLDGTDRSAAAAAAAARKACKAWTAAWPARKARVALAAAWAALAALAADAAEARKAGWAADAAADAKPLDLIALAEKACSTGDKP